MLRCKPYKILSGNWPELVYMKMSILCSDLDVATSAPIERLKHIFHYSDGSLVLIHLTFTCWGALLTGAVTQCWRPLVLLANLQTIPTLRQCESKSLLSSHAWVVVCCVITGFPKAPNQLESTHSRKHIFWRGKLMVCGYFFASLIKHHYIHVGFLCRIVIVSGRTNGSNKSLQTCILPTEL